MIKAIGHVGLQVPNLDESVRWATTVMGLREVERDNGAAYLTHGGVHHSLLYIQAGQAALDHIALEAQDENSMHELRERLAKHGVKIVSERPEELGIKHAIRFLGPAGHVFEVFTEMAGDEPRHTGSGVQPLCMRHRARRRRNWRANWAGSSLPRLTMRVWMRGRASGCRPHFWAASWTWW